MWMHISEFDMCIFYIKSNIKSNVLCSLFILRCFFCCIVWRSKAQPDFKKWRCFYIVSSKEETGFKNPVSKGFHPFTPPNSLKIFLTFCSYVFARFFSGFFWAKFATFFGQFLLRFLTWFPTKIFTDLLTWKISNQGT